MCFGVGIRVQLGRANTRPNSELCFLGLCDLHDPWRNDSRTLWWQAYPWPRYATLQPQYFDNSSYSSEYQLLRTDSDACIHRTWTGKLNYFYQLLGVVNAEGTIVYSVANQKGNPLPPHLQK